MRNWLVVWSSGAGAGGAPESRLPTPARATRPRIPPVTGDTPPPWLPVSVVGNAGGAATTAPAPRAGGSASTCVRGGGTSGAGAGVGSTKSVPGAAEPDAVGGRYRGMGLLAAGVV